MKEVYYSVDKLHKTKKGLEWREARTFTDKKSAVYYAKSHTGRHLVRKVMAVTLFDNGKKVW